MRQSQAGVDVCGGSGETEGSGDAAGGVEPELVYSSGGAADYCYEDYWDLTVDGIGSDVLVCPTLADLWYDYAEEN